jgi:type IV pilus assembly protein PilE
MSARGFTLVEVLVASTVSVVLALTAWPAYQGQLLRAGRSEAIEALQRVQLAQERHRTAFGIYAAELPALGLAATTNGGRYTLALERLGLEAYRLRAQAGGAQQRDSACAALTVEVRQGFATLGPDGRCWNR